MLRLLTAGDNYALFHCVDRSRAELVRWFEWPDRVTSTEAAAEYIADVQKCSRIKLWWLIVDNGIAVGGVQLRLRDGGSSVSLPYWLEPSAQGKGLATKALAEVLQMVKPLGFWKARLEIATDNRRSAKLAERLAFSPIGVPHETMFRGAPQMTQSYERFMADV